MQGDGSKEEQGLELGSCVGAEDGYDGVEEGKIEEGVVVFGGHCSRNVVIDSMIQNNGNGQLNVIEMKVAKEYEKWRRTMHKENHPQVKDAL